MSEGLSSCRMSPAALRKPFGDPVDSDHTHCLGQGEVRLSGVGCTWRRSAASIVLSRLPAKAFPHWRVLDTPVFCLCSAPLRPRHFGLCIAQRRRSFTTLLGLRANRGHVAPCFVAAPSACYHGTFSVPRARGEPSLARCPRHKSRRASGNCDSPQAGLWEEALVDCPTRPRHSSQRARRGLSPPRNRRSWPRPPAGGSATIDRFHRPCLRERVGDTQRSHPGWGPSAPYHA